MRNARGQSSKPISFRGPFLLDVLQQRGNIRKKEPLMDDKRNRGEPDRSKINLQEPYELEYWKKTLGVSEEELRKAVQAVGSSADKVRQHLKK
jgi:hypothetical protein